jgi:hypothetical protein
MAWSQEGEGDPVGRDGYVEGFNFIVAPFLKSIRIPWIIPRREPHLKFQLKIV